MAAAAPIAVWREDALPTRLRILAWAHVVFGGIGLALAALVTFIAAYEATRDAAYQDEAGWFVGLSALLSVAYFVPSFTGGLGILRGLPWARGIIWIESALLVLLIPVGTVLAGFNIWVLSSTRQETADGGIAVLERMVARAIKPILIALVALATLGAMIGIGYLFRDVIDPPRSQVLTPMPSGVPPQVERPTYVPRELPTAPDVPGR